MLEIETSRETTIKHHIFSYSTKSAILEPSWVDGRVGRDEAV